MTFDDFLAAELAGLSRYATVLTGDPQRAHDVLADALIGAQSRWDRIGVMDHPRAYIRRMVTTTFLSEQRRWSVRHIRPTRTGELPEVAVPDPTDAVTDREELAGLLAGLPPRQRAAVVLRFYLGLDNAAIASELDISAGAVRTAISRGLAALRIAVDDSSGAGAVRPHGHDAVRAPGSFDAPSTAHDDPHDVVRAPGSSTASNTPTSSANRGAPIQRPVATHSTQPREDS